MPTFIGFEFEYKNVLGSTTGLLVVKFPFASSRSERPMRVLARDFKASLQTARELLRTDLSTNRPRTMSAARSIVDEEDEETPPVIDVVVVTGTPDIDGGGGGWLGGGWYYPPDGIGSPIEPVAETACHNACYQVYDRIDGAACRRMTNPRLKALCWAATSVKHAACRAECDR
jgi:hypothetical protein